MPVLGQGLVDEERVSKHAEETRDIVNYARVRISISVGSHWIIIKE